MRRGVGADARVRARLLDCFGVYEPDNAYLLKGDVFTEDVIETWISYKMTKEVQVLDLRPHPWEFALYYDA
jgi:glutamine synthetase